MSLRSIWPQIVGEAWADEEFRRRLLGNPKAALADIGVQVPEGHRLQVLEDSPNITHLVVPLKPADLGELPGKNGYTFGSNGSSKHALPIQKPLCTDNPRLLCTDNPRLLCTDGPSWLCTDGPGKKKRKPVKKKSSKKPPAKKKKLPAKKKKK